jgi:hypothetical protein
VTIAKRARIALAAGFALFALALVLVLLDSPPEVAGTNGVPALSAVGYLAGGAKGCQQGGTIPRGTSAVRLSFGSNVGPSVAVRAYSNSSLVTEGSRPSGWGITETVTVPVKTVAETAPNSELCITLGPVTEPVEVHGAALSARGPNGTVKRLERFRIEYLRQAGGSWWSRISTVARRLGLGHAPSGTWVAVLELLLMLAAAAIAVRLVLRTAAEIASEPTPPVAREESEDDGGPEAPTQTPTVAREGGTATTRWGAVKAWLPTAGRAALVALRGIPRAAWMCAAVAVLSAACWSLITPPFQSPDEPSHFAYAQHLAETGELPDTSEDTWSQEENTAAKALHHNQVRWYPEHEQIRSQAEQQTLEQTLSAPLERSGEGGAGVASTQPPVYYALQTIPYYLASSGSILDRLELMRLLSALMAGLTALFGYLFLREALPRHRWAWAIGGLAIALTPLLGFMSGAVNPEAMLIAVSSVAFFLLARAFRRGLTLWLALWTGLIVVLGFETKINFIGLAPGIVLGLFLLGVREAGEPVRALLRRYWRPKPAPSQSGSSRPPARAAGKRASTGAQPAAPPEPAGALLRTALWDFRYAALGLVIAIAPAVIYVIAHAAGGHSTLGSVSQIEHPTGSGSLGGEIEYIWQFYLPRLPGMSVNFPGVAPWRGIWFNRSVGLYGWLDTHFPNWLYDLALAFALLLAALALRSLIVLRRIVWRRLVELATYAVIALGLFVLTGAASYVHFPTQAGTYGEPRYFLPLIALLGAGIALSARGAGRRFGPAAGALIVVLFLAWDVFSQLQTIARFYG